MQQSIIAELVNYHPYIHFTLSRESFEKIYEYDLDVKTKERMLLILNVVYRGKISAQVARDLHRSKSWACEWLKRYDKEGIEGLKTRQKSSGRPSEISEEVMYQIKKELKEAATVGPQNR